MDELSPKEILLSVIFFLLSIALAIFVNPFVMDAFVDDMRIYQNALQIDNDTNQFQYANTTKVGNVFAFGRMNALNPVVLPELLGQWSMIEKVEEEYTRHSREVCNGYDSAGKCTGYRTEYYYTWDRNQSWTFSSSDFEFLSVSFPITSLEISPQFRLELSQATTSPQYLNLVNDNCIYEKDSWWASVGDLRYYYNVLPLNFNASMFVTFNNDDIHAKMYYERNRDQVLEDKESRIRVFNFLYYTTWIVGIVGVYLYWARTYGEIK